MKTRWKVVGLLVACIATEAVAQPSKFFESKTDDETAVRIAEKSRSSPQALHPHEIEQEIASQAHDV